MAIHPRLFRKNSRKLIPLLLLAAILLPIVVDNSYVLGMALLEEITRRNIDVLIIVLSAYDQFEYAQKAISSRKVFEYVLKPIRRGNFCTLLQKAAAAVRSKRAENSPDSQALYDEVRKNYNGFLMQGHTAEGIALVRQKLEALPEPWSDWEGQKRFLISLYTDTQLEAVKQSTKNGQPACLPMNGLVHFEASPYGRRAIVIASAEMNFVCC